MCGFESKRSPAGIAPATAHDSAVAQIARNLLSFQNGLVFPRGHHPTWATYTNAPARQVSLHHNWEGMLWPDIVVVDTARSNAPCLVAEVETSDTLNETVLDRVWKLDMDVCPNFYLFIPDGAAMETSELLMEFRTMTGLPRAMWTYSFDPLWRIILTPV